jgi:hypothetical protein
MMLMVTIGYVFSYLIPTKQKSVTFLIHSTKAFFIAQSGVEYAVRYAGGQNWTTPALLLGLNNPPVNQRNLGGGNFTINYDRITNTLTSIGVIPNASERRVAVSNFTSFLQNPKGMILDPGDPSPCLPSDRRVRFHIRNATEDPVTFTAFSASWSPPDIASMWITTINLAGNQKFDTPPNYTSGMGRQDFNAGTGFQTINSNQAITVVIIWNANITTYTNFVITFYPAVGNGYTFYLDPAGGGLPGC